MIQKAYFALALVALFGSSASQTIVEIAQGLDNYSTLVDLVVTAGLADTLSGDGPFTVLAPSNEAFAAALDTLTPEQQTALTTDTDILTKVLTYHVIAGNILSTDLVDGMMAKTIQGDELKVDISEGMVTFTGASGPVTVEVADVEGSNGVIHGIDGVLIPQEILDVLSPPVEEPGSIVEIAQGLDDYSTLVDLVVTAGLADTLSGDGPFTVLAPSNDAFNAALATLTPEQQTALTTDTDILTKVLTYHVISGNILSTDLVDGMMAETVQGDELMVGILEGIVTFTGASGPVTVEVADVEGSNGVIHGIDGVLIPQEILDVLSSPVEEPGTIVEIAQGLEDYSTLVDLVVTAGLADTLSGDGPFTVLAPSNDAFTAALATLTPEEQTALTTDMDILTKVLTYHVIAGNISSTDLVDGMMAETVQGDELTVGISGGKVTFTGASGPVTVEIADVVASNGVIHGIDGVLIPEDVVLDTLMSTKTLEETSGSARSTVGAVVGAAAVLSVFFM